MRFKLSRNQLEGLLLLVQRGLELTPAEGMADKLIIKLMKEIESRLERKVEKVRVDVKQPKSFTLNEIEAMTLYCWYAKMHEELASDYQYEAIVVDKIFNTIDQTYA